MEIGAYLGRSAALLGYLRRSAERLVVCDLFGAPSDLEADTAENTRQYSDLQRKQFETKLSDFHPELPEIVVEPSQRLRR